MQNDIKARLENDYTYHPPKPDQIERYQRIRDGAKVLALLIADLVPRSREQSLAFTYLEQAVMIANAGIARNEVAE